MRKGGVYDVVGRGEEFKNAMEGLWDVKVVAGERMHFVQGKGGEVSGSIEVEDGMALSSEDSLKDVAEGYETLPSPSVGVDGDGGGGGGDGLLLHIGCKVRVPGWFCVDSDPTRPSVVDLVSDMGNLAPPPPPPPRPPQPHHPPPSPPPPSPPSTHPTSSSTVTTACSAPPVQRG